MDSVEIKLIPCSFVSKTDIPCRNRTRHESGKCIVHHRGKSSRTCVKCTECDTMTYSKYGLCSKHYGRVHQAKFRERQAAKS